jgi:vancomycin resistance protein YoaR
MEPIVSEIAVPARNSQFRLEDGKVTVVTKAKSGWAVDVPAAAEAINDAVLNGDPSVTLTITKVKPEYTDSYRSKIKVNDVLAEASTYYGNSSEPRRRNVETAVRLETGWLIPPDGVFSYAEFIGGVTKEQGFVTGYGIVADGAGGVTTAPVIGGGICQVSTTMFQAGFWAGMDIVERYTHPYWIGTYGEAPSGMKGLDAMVNIEEHGSLDLKLRNTTGNWIAIVLQADGERVSAQVLGTNAGWTVELEGPTITNVVTPSSDFLYTESSELPAGQELQVESAQEGFDASIRRVIKQDGEIVGETVISGTYGASRNTILRGTGT